MSESRSLRDAELAFLALLLRCADATVTPEATVGERGNFYVALRRYYRVSRQQLAAIRSERVPADEIPVVLHIARHAAIEPREVVALRGEHRSWVDILAHFQLSSVIFYVGVAIPPGLPVGKPYGYYRRQARKAWRTSVFTDTDVVNLVNLKFVSEYYGCPPEQVIALCSNGWTFDAIHAGLQRPKPAKRTARKRAKRVPTRK